MWRDARFLQVPLMAFWRWVTVAPISEGSVLSEQCPARPEVMHPAKKEDGLKGISQCDPISNPLVRLSIQEHAQWLTGEEDGSLIHARSSIRISITKFKKSGSRSIVVIVAKSFLNTPSLMMTFRVDRMMDFVRTFWPFCKIPDCRARSLKSLCYLFPYGSIC